MNVILGLSMLVLFFGVLFYLIAKSEGVRDTLMMFCAAIFATGWVLLAISFIRQTSE